jgi:ribonuclease BN (tRNA processing enzyme)
MITVTTLGTGTIALTPRRVRAGHLVETGDVRLLMDCGSGVIQRLAELEIPWMTITHVAITHFHIDHIGDLASLIFAWRHGDLPARTAPIEVIGPAGTSALLDRIAAAYGQWVTQPGFPVTVRELSPREEVSIGAGVSLSCCKVPHTEESVAYAVRDASARIVYSGDTGFDEPFADWAAGSQLLLCECSLPSAMAIPEHLTPEQCADVANRAQPELLALTHLYPPVERLNVLELIATTYDGPTVIATDGWKWTSATNSA